MLLVEKNRGVKKVDDQPKNDESTVEKLMEEARNNPTVKSEKIRFKHADDIYLRGVTKTPASPDGR